MVARVRDRLLYFSVFIFAGDIVSRADTTLWSKILVTTNGFRGLSGVIKFPPRIKYGTRGVGRVNTCLSLENLVQSDSGFTSGGGDTPLRASSRMKKARDGRERSVRMTDDDSVSKCCLIIVNG